MADEARANLLVQLRLPALVVHGDSDRMVPLACGLDTARRIAGAQWHVIPGMGHDLAPVVMQRILDALLPFLSEHTPLS
jgi:pimeloyl-ACP methyl ester carboxylesterase